jgi:hypothetical protein
MGRFKSATTLRPGSSGRDSGYEECDRAQSAERCDSYIYSAVDGTENFAQGACKDGQTIMATTIRCGLADARWSYRRSTGTVMRQLGAGSND